MATATSNAIAVTRYIYVYLSIYLYIYIYIYIYNSFQIGKKYQRRKEGNVLFNIEFNTFYLRLKMHRTYGKLHLARRNLLPPHGLLFPVNSKGSFMSTISQT